MLQSPEQQSLEAVVRTLSAASKTLRLYPAASPIPRQSIAAALSSLEAHFALGAPVLALAIGRGGFTSGGQPVGAAVAGVSDLANELREHGVAELAVVPGASEDEILAFLTTTARMPEEVRQQGGLSVVLASAGVESIRVTDVSFTVLDDAPAPEPEQDFDEFLRALIADPEKLAHWYAAASSKDPQAFGESLMELVRVAGPSGFDGLLGSLASAFSAQSMDGKDVLLGLSLDAGPVRDLAGGMFGKLGAGDIAGAVLGGRFGRNMLSLSNALTSLPLEQVTAQVRAEVQAMLPGTGHTAKEADFLNHMMEVRGSGVAEPALVDATGTYRAVVAAASISEGDLAKARGAVTASAGALSAAGVRMMLSLLDQQQDFELYCSSADNLAAMVPRLIERGDVSLAVKVVSDLAARQSATNSPWPELSSRLTKAIGVAVGPRSMTALVSAALADPGRLPIVRDLVRYGGEHGAQAFVAEAIAHKAEGLAMAEQVLGRRLIDMLNASVAGAQWFQLAPVVERLAHEGDPRSVATLEALLKRPDEQSRREVATGLASAGGPVALRLLGMALKDTSPEVAIVAARAIGRSGMAGAAGLLGGRLDELDVDGDGFLLARELIGALARVPDPAAGSALTKLAGRRALIKRGHFAEVQELAQRALQMRTQAGMA